MFFDMVYPQTFVTFKTLIKDLVKCVGYESWRAFQADRHDLWIVTEVAKLYQDNIFKLAKAQQHPPPRRILAS